MPINDFIVSGINDIINNRIKFVLKELSKDNKNLDYNKLVKQYCMTSANVVFKKKNTKNPIDKNIQCMAKKADGKQCTRRRRIKDTEGNIISPAVDYCGKLLKCIKFGRIDDEEKFKNSGNYIKTRRENIDGEYYLVDPTNNAVFTYNKINPILVGKKINNKLVLIKELVAKHKNIKFKINITEEDTSSESSCDTKSEVSETPIPLVVQV